MTAIRIRVVVGEDDGRRYVLSAIEGDSRFGKPAERFLTCDRIVADAIVTIPIDEPEPAAEMVECPACGGSGVVASGCWPWTERWCGACGGVGQVEAPSDECRCGTDDPDDPGQHDISCPLAIRGCQP